MKKIINVIITSFMLANICLFATEESTNGGNKSGGQDNIKNNKSVVLVAHGYGGTGVGCANYYVKTEVLNSYQVASFEFPDSRKLPENNGKLNKKKTCFGQEQEIGILKDNFDGQKAAGNKVLAFGISRGAMCVLSANIPDAVGIFAESPGASLIDIVDHKCKQFGFGWMPFLGKFVHNCILRPFVFSGYDPRGCKPIDLVKNIPLDTPVFISYTIHDALIPASSSVKLAEELVKTGHINVYLYGSNLGCHAHILSVDQNYKKVFKAFLLKCGIVDDNCDCADGQKMLEDCKIRSLEYVQNLRKSLEFANWKIYWGRNICGFVASTVFVAYAAKKLFGGIKGSKFNSAFGYLLNSAFCRTPKLHHICK